MASDEFDKVELPALEQLQALGWSYVDGAKLAPDTSDERTSFKDAVLENRLNDSIKRLNPWISDQNLGKVVRDLTLTPHTNLSRPVIFQLDYNGVHRRCRCCSSACADNAESWNTIVQSLQIPPASFGVSFGDADHRSLSYMKDYEYETCVLPFPAGFFPHRRRLGFLLLVSTRAVTRSLGKIYIKNQRSNLEGCRRHST